MFTHLQVHTHYSLLEAIGSPKAYVEQAKALGMAALACTDYGGMYGGVEFYEAAKKAGIKPILGVEIGYVPDMKRKEPKEQPGMIVLLARSYQGYQNLLQLISAGHIDGFHEIPRIDPTCLATYATDIITLTGGTRSRLGKRLLEKNNEEHLLDQRRQLQRIVGYDACFLSWIAQDTSQGTDHSCNEATHTFAQARGVPMLVSGNVHYIDKKDQQTFEVALSIKDGKRIYDADRRRASFAQHLKTEEEIRASCVQAGLPSTTINEMIQQTSTIASLIDLEIPMNTILFPQYEPAEDIQLSFVKRKDTLTVH